MPWVCTLCTLLVQRMLGASWISYSGKSRDAFKRLELPGEAVYLFDGKFIGEKGLLRNGDMEAIEMPAMIAALVMRSMWAIHTNVRVIAGRMVFSSLPRNVVSARMFARLGNQPILTEINTIRM